MSEIEHLKLRIAELERERDDLEEIIESRDIHAQRRVRELEAAVDLAIAMQNERVDELDEANARIYELEEAHAALVEMEQQAHRERTDALLRVRELEMAIVRWYEASGDCECREVHFLNLCPTCASEEALADIARAVLQREEEET